MPTEFQELTRAISLIEEMTIYLNRSEKEEIHAGSIFHQEMKGVIDDYYAKRNNET